MWLRAPEFLSDCAPLTVRSRYRVVRPDVVPAEWSWRDFYKQGKKNNNGTERLFSCTAAAEAAVQDLPC